MKTIFTFLFLILGVIGFSQNQSKAAERTAYQQKIKDQAPTITLDLSNIDKTTQEKIKDLILTFKEKIISLEIDESTHIMVIKHTDRFKKEDVLDILTKNDIKTPALISNK